MEQDILIANEAANFIRVSIQRLYELSRTKQLPVILVGQRQYRWSKQALEKWLEQGGTKKEGDDNATN